MPFFKSNLFLMIKTSEIFSRLSIERGDSMPEEGVKKAGKYLLP